MFTLGNNRGYPIPGGELTSATSSPRQAAACDCCVSNLIVSCTTWLALVRENVTVRLRDNEAAAIAGDGRKFACSEIADGTIGHVKRLRVDTTSIY